jgi:CRISPR-associated protein Cas6
MTMVDLVFPVFSPQPIAADHGYALYAALSRMLPVLHSSNGVGVHPIGGRQIGNRELSLTDRSRLIVRVDSAAIGELIQIAGKQLNIDGISLRVGVPQVHALQPAAALRSRLVTIKLKDGLEADAFQAAARKQVDEIGLSSQVILTLGKRRTLRIKDKEVVGYEVIIEGLSAEESLLVQERGLGGRRHMGCGVFVPFERKDT